MSPSTRNTPKMITSASQGVLVWIDLTIHAASEPTRPALRAFSATYFFLFHVKYQPAPSRYNRVGWRCRQLDDCNE